MDKDNQEHEERNPKLEQIEQIIGTSTASITSRSARSSSRKRSIYFDLLERLKKDFNQRWEKQSVSSSKGLEEFEPIKTLGTGTFGRVKDNQRAEYTRLLDNLKGEFLKRWQTMVISNDNGLETFIRIKTLGMGQYGTVVLVKRKEGDIDTYHAMKVIDKRRILSLRQLDHTYFEKKILEALRFPFIVHMEYCFKDNSYIYFVMPFINGGEMFTHLRRMRKFTEILAKFYAAQVVLSLEFLHCCDILYRDLKPENILIDPKGYIKIADLGFCKIVKGRTWTFCGTPEYIAPEIILNRGYGKAVDWWSFGVLLYEMNAGFAPFTSFDPMTMYEKIVYCRYKMPKVFSPDLQSIIANLLQTDLTRRYGNLKNGIQDIKMHRWFREIDWFALYNRQVIPPYIPTVKMLNDTSYFNAITEEKMRIVKSRTWTLCGTPDYIAPEVVLGKCYGKQVDWWALGVLIYEMDAGYPPFASKNEMKTFGKIVECKYKFPSFFSHDLQDLVKNLLQIDLSRRYGNLRNGVWDIKNHKWFKSVDWMEIYERKVEPPYIPTLKTILDTSFFDSYKEVKMKMSDQNLYEDEFALF